MTLYTKGNLNKGSISFRQKSHVQKLGYTVKFQEAVQLSNAVSSTCLLPKVSSSGVPSNEVRHKKVAG